MRLLRLACFVEISRRPIDSTRTPSPNQLFRGFDVPSTALVRWQNDRTPRLAEMDAHCDRLLSAPPPPPLLAQESLQGYVMLLSGHFQGFCRDLYTECAQLCAAVVPPGLRATVQAQFSAELRLDNKNPTVETIRSDFERFGFALNLPAADPANALRVTHLGHLNYWRNASAHQKSLPPPLGVPPILTLPDIRNWRMSFGGLAVSIDGIMYQQLLRILGSAPW
jgi:hypothetical protein